MILFLGPNDIPVYRIIHALLFVFVLFFYYFRTSGNDDLIAIKYSKFFRAVSESQTGYRCPKKIHVFISSLLLKLFVLNSRGNKKKKPKQKYYSKKTDSPNGIWIQPFWMVAFCRGTKQARDCFCFVF